MFIHTGKRERVTSPLYVTRLSYIQTLMSKNPHMTFLSHINAWSSTHFIASNVLIFKCRHNASIYWRDQCWSIVSVFTHTLFGQEDQTHQKSLGLDRWSWGVNKNLVQTKHADWGERSDSFLTKEAFCGSFGGVKVDHNYFWLSQGFPS